MVKSLECYKYNIEILVSKQVILKQSAVLSNNRLSIIFVQNGAKILTKRFIASKYVICIK